MPTTKRADLIFTDILQAAVSGAFAGKVALAGTGAAILSMTLPGLGADGSPFMGGDTIRVPYFDSIGELDDAAEGDALTPRKLSLTSETGTVVRSGVAGQITSWAQLTAMYADPYAEFAKQFATAAIRRIDKALIDAALGTDLSLDKTGEVGALAQINYNNIIDAMKKWGDERDDEPPSLMVMHSNIEADARKLVDLSGRPLFLDSAQDGGLPRFCGVPVKMSDRLTPDAGTPTAYPVLICKRNALAAWVNGEPTIETDRDILSASDVTALHMLHVAHLYKRPRGGTGTKRGVVKLLVKASA